MVIRKVNAQFYTCVYLFISLPECADIICVLQSVSDTDDPIHIINIAMRLNHVAEDNSLALRFQNFIKRQVDLF
jgi:hypothetical protein